MLRAAARPRWRGKRGRASKSGKDRDAEADDHLAMRTETAPARAAYARRFDAVVEYIDDHLDGDLSVDALSRVANFSAFHFHRQSSAHFGVAPSASTSLQTMAANPRHRDMMNGADGITGRSSRGR
jgi:AraC-like DNA-binding protein